MTRGKLYSVPGRQTEKRISLLFLFFLIYILRIVLDVSGAVNLSSSTGFHLMVLSKT